jgi:hypothetical protein
VISAQVNSGSVAASSAGAASSAAGAASSVVVLAAEPQAVNSIDPTTKIAKMASNLLFIKSSPILNKPSKYCYSVYLLTYTSVYHTRTKTTSFIWNYLSPKWLPTRK